jgi:hypothetical protein
MTAATAGMSTASATWLCRQSRTGACA